MIRKTLLPRVKALKIEDPYKLILTFTNDEIKVYDVQKYLDENPQHKLHDKNLFNAAYVSFGTV